MDCEDPPVVTERGAKGQSRILKPVIKELVRTEVHPPFLELLVDRITIVPNIKDKKGILKAFRIWLNDGDKCIQALLKRDLHPFVTVGEIREGSYVRVTKYQLARGEKLVGEGYILYLQISDLIPIAHDGRLPKEITIDRAYEIHEENKPQNTAQRGVTLESTSKRELDVSPVGPDVEDAPASSLVSEGDAVDLIPWYDEQRHNEGPSAIIAGSSNNNKNERKRKFEDVQTPFQQLSPNISSSPPKQPRLSKSHTTPDDHSVYNTRPTARDLLQISIPPPQLPPLPPDLPKPLLPITRPLKITPLSQLTGPNATRNKVLDVLAVVYSVTPDLVLCPGIRPGKHYKRELRIVDGSTSKKVMLSVFVEPQAFMPAIGTVALFRSVTTNRWDGGSLNAYARDCEGKRWFLPEGEAEVLRGCDTRGLKEWWLRSRMKEGLQV